MPAQLGKQALLDAAAALMDARGVDNVTLLDIREASGHRNRSAVQYHFGDHDGVVRAVIKQTMDPIDAERNALLDHLEQSSTPLTPRSVVEVLVGPLGRQLRTPQGRQYLRLCAQLINHPRFMNDARDAVALTTSVPRCARHLAPTLNQLPPPIAAERARQALALGIRACGDQARLIDTPNSPAPVLPTDEFITNLVDTILAILQAPTSIKPTPNVNQPAPRPARQRARRPTTKP